MVCEPARLRHCAGVWYRNVKGEIREWELAKARARQRPQPEPGSRRVWSKRLTGKGSGNLAREIRNGLLAETHSSFAEPSGSTRQRALGHRVISVRSRRPMPLITSRRLGFGDTPEMR